MLSNYSLFLSNFCQFGRINNFLQPIQPIRIGRTILNKNLYQQGSNKNPNFPVTILEGFNGLDALKRHDLNTRDGIFLQQVQLVSIKWQFKEGIFLTRRYVLIHIR